MVHEFRVEREAAGGWNVVRAHSGAVAFGPFPSRGEARGWAAAMNAEETRRVQG